MVQQPDNTQWLQNHPNMPINPPFTPYYPYGIPDAGVGRLHAPHQPFMKHPYDPVGYPPAVGSHDDYSLHPNNASVPNGRCMPEQRYPPSSTAPLPPAADDYLLDDDLGPALPVLPPDELTPYSRPPSPYEDDEYADEIDEKQLLDELDKRWILNLTMHFRDRAEKEKFFITYIEPDTNVWRRVTVTCEYRDAELDSLEQDLKHLVDQRDKNQRIYESIRDSIPEIQFFDTVTNLKLRTVNRRLRINVAEDANEAILYPPMYSISHLDRNRLPRVRENEVQFNCHFSGFAYKVQWRGKSYVKKEIPGPDTVDEFLYEINALYALLDSQSVIRLKAIVVDDISRVVKGLLIDLAEKGALIDMFYDYNVANDIIPWSRRERWARQIVQGLAEIHEAGFVQGDFTISNIVVDENDDAKIIDINRRGCPIGWEPPEFTPLLDSNQKLSMYIGIKSDLYQLGITLWALAKTDYEPSRRPRPLTFKPEDAIPEYFQKIVGICLDERPQDRLAAKDLLALFPRSEKPGPPPLNRTPVDTINQGTLHQSTLDAGPPDSRPTSSGFFSQRSGHFTPGDQSDLFFPSATSNTNTSPNRYDHLPSYIVADPDLFLPSPAEPIGTPGFRSPMRPSTSTRPSRSSRFSNVDTPDALSLTPHDALHNLREGDSLMSNSEGLPVFPRDFAVIDSALSLPDPGSLSTHGRHRSSSSSHFANMIDSDLLYSTRPWQVDDTYTTVKLLPTTDALTPSSSANIAFSYQTPLEYDSHLGVGEPLSISKPSNDSPEIGFGAAEPLSPAAALSSGTAFVQDGSVSSLDSVNADPAFSPTISEEPSRRRVDNNVQETQGFDEPLSLSRLPINPAVTSHEYSEVATPGSPILARPNSLTKPSAESDTLLHSQLPINPAVNITGHEQMNSSIHLQQTPATSTLHDVSDSLHDSHLPLNPALPNANPLPTDVSDSKLASRLSIDPVPRMANTDFPEFKTDIMTTESVISRTGDSDSLFRTQLLIDPALKSNSDQNNSTVKFGPGPAVHAKQTVSSELTHEPHLTDNSRISTDSAFQAPPVENREITTADENFPPQEKVPFSCEANMFSSQLPLDPVPAPYGNHESTCAHGHRPSSTVAHQNVESLPSHSDIDNITSEKLPVAGSNQRAGFPSTEGSTLASSKLLVNPSSGIHEKQEMPGAAVLNAAVSQDEESRSTEAGMFFSPTAIRPTSKCDTSSVCGIRFVHTNHSEVFAPIQDELSSQLPVKPLSTNDVPDPRDEPLSTKTDLPESIFPSHNTLVSSRFPNNFLGAYHDMLILDNTMPPHTYLNEELPSSENAFASSQTPASLPPTICGPQKRSDESPSADVDQRRADHASETMPVSSQPLVDPSLKIDSKDKAGVGNEKSVRLDSDQRSSFSPDRAFISSQLSTRSASHFGDTQDRKGMTNPPAPVDPVQVLPPSERIPISSQHQSCEKQKIAVTKDLDANLHAIHGYPLTENVSPSSQPQTGNVQDTCVSNENSVNGYLDPGFSSPESMLGSSSQFHGKERITKEHPARVETVEQCPTFKAEPLSLLPQTINRQDCSANGVPAQTSQPRSLPAPDGAANSSSSNYCNRQEIRISEELSTSMDDKKAPSKSLLNSSPASDSLTLKLRDKQELTIPELSPNHIDQDHGSSSFKNTSVSSQSETHDRQNTNLSTEPPVQNEQFQESSSLGDDTKSLPHQSSQKHKVIASESPFVHVNQTGSYNAPQDITVSSPVFPCDNQQMAVANQSKSHIDKDQGLVPSEGSLGLPRPPVHPASEPNEQKQPAASKFSPDYIPPIERPLTSQQAPLNELNSLFTGRSHSSAMEPTPQL